MNPHPVDQQDQTPSVTSHVPPVYGLRLHSDFLLPFTHSREPDFYLRDPLPSDYLDSAASSGHPGGEVHWNRKKRLPDRILAHLKKPNPVRSLTICDSKTVGVTSDGAHFITDPLDIGYIPEPPSLSTCNLKYVEDDSFGHEDPIRWPQLYNRQYPHYAVLPSRPGSKESEHPYFAFRELWDDVGEEDCVESRLGLLAGMALLSTRKQLLLASAQKYLHERLRERGVQAYLQERPDQRSFTLFYAAFTQLTLNRLSGVAATPMQIRRLVLHFHRAWLTVIAYLDYMVIFRPRMISATYGTTRPPDPHVKGTFVLDPKDAWRHRAAGVPVWLVHPGSTLSDHILGKLIDLNSPEARIYTGKGGAPSPDLWAGSARTERKYLEIVKEMMRRDGLPWVYDAHSLKMIRERQPPNPVPQRDLVQKGLLAMHLTMGQKNRAIMNEQVCHLTSLFLLLFPDTYRPDFRIYSDNPSYATFAEFYSPSAPQPIGGWLNANLNIDIHSAQHASINPDPSEGGYFLPEPGLFTRTKDLWQRTLYLLVWSFLKWPVVSHRETVSDSTPGYSSDFWSAVLGLPSRDNHRSAEEEEDCGVATQQLLDDIRNQFPGTWGGFTYPTLPANPFDLAAIDSGNIRAELASLCAASFRIEFRALDRRADTTFELASLENNETAPDLLTELRKHRILREHRQSLVFHRPGTLSQDVEDSLFAGEPSRRRVRLGRLWSLMCAWPGRKPNKWRRGSMLEDLVKHELYDFEIEEIEGILAKFYAQTFFDYFGRPAVLPRSFHSLSEGVVLL